MVAGPCRARSKCTPSAIVSIDVTATGRARTTAASSPVQRSTRGPGAPSTSADRLDQIELGHGISLTVTRPTLLERAGEAASGVSSLGSGNPRRKMLLQYGFAGLIFACLILFVARQWSQLPDFDWRFQPGWLAVSAVCVAAFYAIEAEIWRWIVTMLGAHIDPIPSRALWGKSLLARYVPTNVLMVVGRVVMAEKHGVPKRVTLTSVVYELGLAFGTAVIVGAYFVIELPDLDDQPARYAVLAVIPIVLAVFHPRVFEPLVNYRLSQARARAALPGAAVRPCAAAVRRVHPLLGDDRLRSVRVCLRAAPARRL